MKTIFQQFVLATGLALALGACSANPPSEDKTQDDAAFVPPIDIDPDAFIEGNLYFIAYHELGHAFVSEFQLPIAGREEDAVDRLATWLMTPEGDAPPEYLMGAIRGWFMTAADVPLSKIEWWGEHGADSQRAYQIACLLYGTDPKAFNKVAEVVELPDNRRESCEYDAGQNSQSWDKLLADHMRPEGGAAAPGDSIAITYAPTTKYTEDAEYLRKLGLLEDLAGTMATHYRFPDGVALEARECDEVNAFWNREERMLTLCYEMVADYRDLATTLKPNKS